MAKSEVETSSLVPLFVTLVVFGFSWRLFNWSQRLTGLLVMRQKHY